MSTTRVKKRARRSSKEDTVSPKESRTTAASASPESLPPSGIGSDTSPSLSTEIQTAEKKPYWFREKSSIAYEQAMKVFAMRAAGLQDKEIAEAMSIAPQTLWNICHIAGRNGWVSDQLAKAKDVVEFQIMPKALRVIEDGLEDTHRNEKTGLMVAQHIALKVVDGALWSREQLAEGMAKDNIIAIKIEMAPGTPTVMREGTGGGVGAYVDAEVVADVGQS